MALCTNNFFLLVRKWASGINARRTPILELKFCLLNIIIHIFAHFLKNFYYFIFIIIPFFYFSLG